MSKFDLHTFDTQPTAVIEIYSSDDPPQWILSYTAPQTMEDLFECLAEEDHLARWPPPSGKEWNTLQSAGGVQVAWGHSVEAGKYKIVARRPRPAASFTTPARSRPSPSPPPSPSAEQSTPLRVDGRGTSGAAVIVLQDSSTTYPASTAYFNALDTGTQEAIRTGNSRSEEAIWDFVSQVYGEWSSFFVPEAANRAVVTTANRKYVAGQAFRCITSSRRTQSGRLLAGVRGIGKSQLLVLLCIASQIAFGTTLLAIYHDFAQNGKGKARHSLASILRLAIITRWPDSEDKIDDLLAAETGSDIHRCVSICAALGKAHNHNQVPVTMALFADEVQNLFAGQRPSQRLVSELKTAALATGLATFLSGIAYSLQDGLSKENFDLGDKMRTVRLLPITTREELQAVRNLWHEDWRTTDDLPAGTTDQQLELDRRIFLHTGGVLRNMFYYSTADQFRESIKEPPADSKALAVLAFLYSTNRTTLIDRGATEFDPFQQAAVPITEVCNMTDTRWDEAVVHKLADDGWLLLDGDGHDMKVMFLRPAHYSLMERRHQNLTLLERAAIRFPEGRTLGEQWEVFYAEHLVERRALQWFDTAKPRHLELFQHMRKHNEQYFRDHQLKLFKPSPDTIGYGQRIHSPSSMYQRQSGSSLLTDRCCSPVCGRSAVVADYSCPYLRRSRSEAHSSRQSAASSDRHPGDALHSGQGWRETPLRHRRPAGRVNQVRQGGPRGGGVDGHRLSASWQDVSVGTGLRVG